MAFFSVTDPSSDETREGPPTNFAILQERFLEAERLLVPGEDDRSVADPGALVVRLRGGISIDVTWYGLDDAS